MLNWQISKETREALCGYTLTAILSLVALAGTMRLWRADVSVPFGYGNGDQLPIQIWLKSTLETGWYLHNDRLGAPFTHDMHDYPTADHLHLGAMKLLGTLVTRDFWTVFNVYYILGFPLAALTSLWTCRRLGVTWGPAILCSLLFALMPWHFARGPNHLFLSSYFMIPPLVLVMLWIAQDQLWLARRGDGTGTWQKFECRREIAFATVICLLVGAAGVYFAFFGCVLLMAAGAWGAIQRKRWYPLFTAAWSCSLISIVLGILLSPTFFYVMKHGKNSAAVHRGVDECDNYALRINEFFQPQQGHPLGQLIPDSSKPNWIFYFGLIGIVGLLVLLGWLLFNRSRKYPHLDTLAMLNGAAILLATTGGFGWLFNHLVSHWIRCYQRIVAYVQFFAYLAVALLLNELVQRYAPASWRRRGVLLLCAGLTLLGVIDQTIPGLQYNYPKDQVTYRSDAEFVRSIEESLPQGAMVFQLPIASFPESPIIHKFSPYCHLTNYLHSQHLRWSYGGMKGRFGDRWQQAVEQQELPRMLRDLALAGFSGIQIDRRGYPDSGVTIEGNLRELLQSSPVISSDQKKSYFSMASLVANLRGQYNPLEWERERAYTMNPVFVSWGDGFSFHEGDRLEYFRWCGHQGELSLENNSSEPRPVLLRLTHSFPTPKEAPLHITSNLLPGGEQVATQTKAATELRLSIPPGKHQIHFATDAPSLDLPADQRTLVFRVHNLRVTPDGTAASQTAQSVPGKSATR